MAVPLRGARNRRVSLLRGGYHQHLRLTRTRPSPLSLSLVLGAIRPLGSLRSTTEAGFNGAVGASSAPEPRPLGHSLHQGTGYSATTCTARWPISPVVYFHDSLSSHSLHIPEQPGLAGRRAMPCRSGLRTGQVLYTPLLGVSVARGGSSGARHTRSLLASHRRI